jgi:hypothetical protein
MARWIADHTLDTNTEELAARHQRAMLACVFPLQYTSDEYDNMEGDEDDE